MQDRTSVHPSSEPPYGELDRFGLVRLNGWHCSPECVGEAFCRCGECHRESECQCMAGITIDGPDEMGCVFVWVTSDRYLPWGKPSGIWYVNRAGQLVDNHVDRSAPWTRPLAAWALGVS